MRRGRISALLSELMGVTVIELHGSSVTLWVWQLYLNRIFVTGRGLNRQEYKDEHAGGAKDQTWKTFMKWKTNRTAIIL